ncbi:GNAT family N-acetyltransferase [Flexivirga caeni]|uniref:GNAT family N-acetyltransferase n=1 Tax=Flexivirga caeni TaxID=2294115 RepID=UPI0013150788|nr:GNAT family N-acetyltransferase [Flexivirga caeni]
MDLVIRDRQDADLPALADLLERQQPQTRYPFIWPFPRPIEEFLKRPTELRSWVAELDGELVGHVAVERVEDDPIGRSWAAAHGASIDELRCVGVFFSDVSKSGQGIGSRLLALATQVARAEGYPVLDVVTAHRVPIDLYLRRGWRIIDTVQAPWHPETDLPIHLMILPRSASSV